MATLQSCCGLLVLTGFCWLLSENRRAVRWRVALVGLALQLGLALLLLKLPWARRLFLTLNELMAALQRASEAGTAFVFGYLGGAPLPFGETGVGSSFVFGFRALPLVLLMSALSSLLFHWRILPLLVNAFSWLLQRSLGVGGALGLGTAANIFVGMVEAPLLVRPYLEQMSRGELFALMTAGMATIAGTVMALYAGILGPVLPDAMGHLLTASIISAPAAIMVARLLIPEDGPATAGTLRPDQHARSSMDAVTRGTLDGLRLLAGIVALLVVLLALVHLANAMLTLLPSVAGAPLSLERMLGWIMAPVAWLMGVPWNEAPLAGSLMGTKTVLNELLAYLRMAGLPPEALSERSRTIMTYAMCGFANFGSLGIMLGGLGGMAPGRRQEIVALGMKSILAGTIATCLTGTVVGIIL